MDAQNGLSLFSHATHAYPKVNWHDGNHAPTAFSTDNDDAWTDAVNGP
jgi:hypothetical protein